MEEIKNCPVCGHKPGIDVTTYFGEKRIMNIHCVCGLGVQDAPTKTALEIWNSLAVQNKNGENQHTPVLPMEDVEFIARYARHCPNNPGIFPKITAGTDESGEYRFKIECPYGKDCAHGPLKVISDKSMIDAVHQWNLRTENHRDERSVRMSEEKIVKIIFPDGFVFPTKYNIMDCSFNGCPLALSEETGFYGCSASDNGTCPFHGGEDSCEIRVRKI